MLSFVVFFLTKIAAYHHYNNEWHRYRYRYRHADITTSYRFIYRAKWCKCAMLV